MTPSIQQFITTPIRMAFVLEEPHLRQLDHILRRDNPTVQYITGTQSLVFTTYESVEDVIHMVNSPDDPLIRLEVKRVTGDTHVTLLFSSNSDLIKITIMNDDSQRPDFRHQISSDLAVWLEQIKAPHSHRIRALQPGVLIPVMCLVSMLFIILGLMLPSWDMPFRGDIPIFVGVVIIPTLLVLVLWTQGRLFPAGQFNFGSGRKTKRDER